MKKAREEERLRKRRERNKVAATRLFPQQSCAQAEISIKPIQSVVMYGKVMGGDMGVTSEVIWG